MFLEIEPGKRDKDELCNVSVKLSFSKRGECQRMYDVWSRAHVSNKDYQT